MKDTDCHLGHSMMNTLLLLLLLLILLLSLSFSLPLSPTHSLEEVHGNGSTRLLTWSVEGDGMETMNSMEQSVAMRRSADTISSDIRDIMSKQ